MWKNTTNTSSTTFAQPWAMAIPCGFSATARVVGAQEKRALNLLDATFTELRTQRGIDFSAHLIAGNHDSCHPLYTDSASAQREFLMVFDSVQPFQYFEFAGEPAWLCHFPRPGFDHEGMDSRHDELRLTVERLVHGHLHSATAITGRGQVDVASMRGIWHRLVKKRSLQHSWQVLRNSLRAYSLG